MKRFRSRGFTLIEIAVVIAVIAILAILSITVYQRVQTEARDTKRRNDILRLAMSLEKYYDKNGAYPAGCGGDTCTPWPGWYYDSDSIISIKTTSSQLSTLLEDDLSTVLDPRRQVGPNATPIIGGNFEILNTTPGYVYRGGLTITPGGGVMGGIIRLKESGSSRSCTIWANPTPGAQPPNDTMAFTLAYYAESSQTWQIMHGNRGAKPYYDATSTPGFCQFFSN